MSTYLSRLASLVESKGAWRLLFGSAVGLEAAALFFQYNMGLNPCIMCIYQRTAMLGIVGAGLLGSFASSWSIGRLAALALWLTASVWGWRIASEHVEIQTATYFVMCEFVPNFPSWLPLHEWIPAFFAATGDCGNIDWQFLTLSMPQWMIIIFAFYSVLGAVMLGARLLVLRRI